MKTLVFLLAFVAVAVALRAVTRRRAQARRERVRETAVRLGLTFTGIDALAFRTPAPRPRSLQRHQPDVRLGDPPREVRRPVTREAWRADHIRRDGQNLPDLLRAAVDDVERLLVRHE